MESFDLLAEARAELDAGRPARALGLVRRGAPDPPSGPRLELTLRCLRQAGQLKTLVERAREWAPTASEADKPVVSLFLGLGLAELPGEPRLEAIRELAVLAGKLGAGPAAELELGLAHLLLECGAVRMAERRFDAAREGLPEGPIRSAAALRFALRRGDHERAASLAEDPHLSAPDRALYAAACGDWTSVDIELERWVGILPEDPRTCENVARFAEAVGSDELAYETLVRIEALFPTWGEPEARAWRLMLACLRTGREAEAAAQRSRITADPLLVAALRDLPATLRDEPARSLVATGVPLAEWPAVHAPAASLCAALWRAGRRIDPSQLEARLPCEDGDVSSCFEMLDVAREDGLAFARFEGGPEAIRRVLEIDLPVMVRLLVPGLGPSWALVTAYDGSLELLRLVQPERGRVLELPAATLEAMQGPMGQTCVVVGPPDKAPEIEALRLQSSMAQESLDQAARRARLGELAGARERLERARGYRQGFRPLERLLAELEVTDALADPATAPARLGPFLDRLETSWPGEGWPSLYRARLHVERGEKAQALEVLRKAARRGGVGADLLTELGDLEEELGGFDAAKEAWTRAHRLDPVSPRPREQVSRWLRRRGELKAALILAETGVEGNPQNPYNHEMRGLLLGELGAPPAEVEASLRKALEINPLRPYAYGFLCELHLKHGRRDEAVRVLEEGARLASDPYPYWARVIEVHYDARDYPRAIEAADRALASKPESPLALGLKGGALARSGQPEQGLVLLERAIELDPADPWPVREAVIHLRDLGRLDEARALATRGAVRFPTDAPMHAQLALVLQASGAAAEAREAARKSAELAGPDDFEALRLLAQATLDAGGPEEARAVWAAAVGRSSRPAEVRKQEVSFLLDVAQFAEAESASVPALEERPEDPELLAWRGYALVRLGRPSDAIPWLRRALAVSPEFGFARSVLLDALTEEGDEAGAVALYEETDATLTPLGYECALVAYARLGRFEEALAVCRRAALKLPGAEGFFRRRAAQLLMDDLCEYEEALREAEAAVKASPEDPRVHESLAYALAFLRRFEAAEDAMDRMLEAGAAEVDLLRFRRFLARRTGDHRAEESCARMLAALQREDARAGLRWLMDAAAASLARDRSGAAFRGYLEGALLQPADWGSLAQRAAAAALPELAQELLDRAGTGGGPDALVAEGEIRGFKGDFDGALRAYRALELRFPHDHRGSELQARVLIAQGRVQDGLAAAERAHRAARVHCETANLMMGAAQLLAGDRSGAQGHFRRAARLGSGHSRDLTRAMGQWSEGDSAGAELTLRAFVEDPQSNPLDRALARTLAQAAHLSLA